MSTTRRWLKWVIVACGLAACDGGVMEDAGIAADAGVDAGPIEPALTVVDQTLALSTVVTIAMADLDGPGWIAIADGGGAMLGMTSLSRGRHTGVAVGLDRRSLSSETLHAALYADAGATGTFEPADDPKLLEASFTVSVEAGTPDVRISILNIGDSAFVFNAAEPSRYAITADPAAENPPIELRRGWRYEVFNPANVSHPFELIRADASGVDEVRLSQRVEGTLHDDPTVAFEIVTPAFFRFTVSPSLEAAVDAYRCLIHPHMRGGVSYTSEP